MKKKNKGMKDAYAIIEQSLISYGYDHEEAQEMISQLIRQEACYYVDAMRSIYGNDFGKDRYDKPVDGNYLANGYIELEAEIAKGNDRTEAINNIIKRMEELNFDSQEKYNKYIYKNRRKIFMQ